MVAEVHANPWQLKDFSARGRISETTTLGEQAPEEFEAYDFSAYFKAPWLRYDIADWHTGFGLTTSAGFITNEDGNALILSAVPLLTFSSSDERFVFDAGAGVALMSRSEFGQQDFGGFFQFALTVGIRIPLYERLGVGYRFQHYSDAGVHSSTSIGADFHMLEFYYQF